MESLINNSVRPSTANNYQTIWRHFNRFLIRLDYMPPDWEHRVALFCAFLVQKGNQSATIRSYVSAIKTILKADKYEWNDQKVLLGSLARACKLSNDTLKCRLPIQKGLLELILFEIQRIYPKQPYLCKLYQAILCLGYYGLMCIGELTLSTNGVNDHSIKNRNIHIGTNKDKILVILYTSKTHDESTYLQQIKISSLQEQQKVTRRREQTGSLHAKHSFFCPFRALRDYITLKAQDRSMPGEQNFFIFRDGVPVYPVNVWLLLCNVISRLNLDASLYNCQSLRIGHATDMMKAGIPVDTIKKLGRWKSNAIYKYLRY